MAYGTPPWLLGKNVTIQITPQAVANDGTFSTLSGYGPLTCNGRLDQDEQDLSYTTDNISPRDAFNSNPVVYEAGTTFTITEIPQAWALWSSAGTAVWGQGNTLEKASRASIYHLVQVTAVQNDLTTTIAQWSGYCILESVRRSSPKAKGSYVGTFRTVIVANTGTGAFQANPSVA